MSGTEGQKSAESWHNIGSLTGRGPKRIPWAPIYVCMDKMFFILQFCHLYYTVCPTMNAKLSLTADQITMATGNTVSD